MLKSGGFTDNPNKDMSLPNPPEDSISSISWSPIGLSLAASSWDNKVQVWRSTSSGFQSVNSTLQQAPPLATSWNGVGRSFAEYFSCFVSKQILLFRKEILYTLVDVITK